MVRILPLASVLLVLFACGEPTAPPEGEPEPEAPLVTESFSLAQHSPPVDAHGTVVWPKDAGTVRFTYRIVPRRSGRAGAWSVAEEDRVRGVVLLPPQSNGRGRLSPLDGTHILADRLLAPEGWTARRAEWLGGEVLWFRTEIGILPADGVEVGLELAKPEDGWPSAFSAVYTCAVALTRDGELPTTTGGEPAYLPNLVGPLDETNVAWFWFRSKRAAPSDGISGAPPVSLPIAAAD